MPTPSRDECSVGYPSSKARNPSKGIDSSSGVSLSQPQRGETVNVPFPERHHSFSFFSFIFPRRTKCAGMLDSGFSFAKSCQFFRQLSVNSANYHFTYNRLTRVQSLLIRKPSPLQSSITSELISVYICMCIYMCQYVVHQRRVYACMRTRQDTTRHTTHAKREFFAYILISLLCTYVCMS